MTQRNPNNQRYQQDKRTGVSRKSASSAKPKNKAANSVVMGSNKKTKTKQETKADKRAARAKERERERRYYTPPTQHFKNLKKLWWACLGGAIVCTLVSWFGRNALPQQVSFGVLIAAYAFIILALYLDLGVMRKERRKYAAEMEASKSKEARAAEREEKRRAKEAEKKAAAEESPDEAAEPEPEKKGLFGFMKK